MPDRMFYIEGSWLTYEQAHSLGYSLLPQRLVTFYSVSNDSVVIKQDSGDNTYYDSVNHTWVVDFADLNLYKRVSNKTFYRGESSADYRCYTASITESTQNYLFYNSLIRTLSDAYEKYGITSYECENIILDSSGSPIVWFDSTTGKYFDDRDWFHRWVDSIGDEEVIMYDSSATESSQIYENEAADYFYIDDSFISRSEFYTYDNYGIVRENVYVLKDDEVYGTYYDSYSDEYCIPEVTEIWVSKEDLLDLGYIFVDGVANMWLCETPLHLPWKYLPSSATLSFTNTSHSDLQITLPEDREASIGSEIVLPEITGVYTDANSVRWVATRWSIGEFNSTFVLNENTVADLECEKVKVTLSFVNAYYQTLEIPLPGPKIADNSDLVTLPLVTGEYEDEEHIKYTPYAWDIGQFGQEYVLRTDTTANILCEKMKVTLSFTNNSHRELEIPLPGIIERHYGDTVILPRMRGVYRDEDNHPWIPLKWSLDEFDRLYTITESTSTDLVWQPLSEIPEIALCGSMPSDSGSSAETSDYIVLVAVGSMKLDLPDWPSTYLTDNYEVYSGQIEVWDSHYVQPIEPDFEKNSYITSDQMICGTIRKWGVNDNSYIDFSMACSTIKSDPMKYVDVPLTDNYEIFSGRLKIWDSSYEQSSVDFPVKSGESSEQMYGGTIRKWGIYANHEILMSEYTLIGNSSLDPMAYTDIKLTYNPEIYGDRLKVYDKHYTPTPEPEFPDKPVVEPNNQMYGGTIRLKGNKANRGISIDIVFDDYINPNDS